MSSIINFVVIIIFVLLTLTPVMSLQMSIGARKLLKNQLKNNVLDDLEGNNEEEKKGHLLNALDFNKSMIIYSVIKILILMTIFFLISYFFLI